MNDGTGTSTKKGRFIDSVIVIMSAMRMSSCRLSSWHLLNKLPYFCGKILWRPTNTIVEFSSLPPHVWANTTSTLLFFILQPLTRMLEHVSTNIL